MVCSYKVVIHMLASKVESGDMVAPSTCQQILFVAWRKLCRHSVLIECWGPVGSLQQSRACRWCPVCYALRLAENDSTHELIRMPFSVTFIWLKCASTVICSIHGMLRSGRIFVCKYLASWWAWKSLAMTVGHKKTSDFFIFRRQLYVEVLLSLQIRSFWLSIGTDDCWTRPNLPMVVTEILITRATCHAWISMPMTTFPTSFRHISRSILRRLCTFTVQLLLVHLQGMPVGRCITCGHQPMGVEVAAAILSRRENQVVKKLVVMRALV